MAGPSARLTKREREVVELSCEGLADKEVATKLGIGSVTVRTHIARAKEKLGASTRTQLGRTVLRIEDRRNGHGAASDGHDATHTIGQSGNRAIGQSGNE